MVFATRRVVARRQLRMRSTRIPQFNPALLNREVMAVPTEAEAKAKHIIEDVFRRADKNDDGSLSLEEFQTFFADGVLSNEELEKIFREIDTHKTNNLDTSELCEYFSKFWGPFEHIFAFLDDLGASISNAMTVTAQQYDGRTFMEQFATRFLLKETVNHMAALERPLESAIDSLEEHAARDKVPAAKGSPTTVTTVGTGAAVLKPRWQRRLLQSQSSEPRGGTDTGLSGEVCRLASLISKLENKVNLELVEEEEVPQGKDNTITVVSREIVCMDDTISDFKQSLKLYTEGARGQPGSLHYVFPQSEATTITMNEPRRILEGGIIPAWIGYLAYTFICVRMYAGSYRFEIYEVWQDSECLESHYASKVSRTFRRSCVDQLNGPEKTTTFCLPVSWWPSD